MRKSIISNNGRGECPQPNTPLHVALETRKYVDCLARLRTLILLLVLSAPFNQRISTAFADDLGRSQSFGNYSLDSRTRIAHNEARLNKSLRFLPIVLDDGSRLTVISPEYWTDISKEVSEEITRTHQQLTQLFGTAPPFRTSIRIMEEYDFYELTGAPSWTNAMFFRGEIIIPLDSSKAIDMNNLRRSVKHEYSHAVLSSISAGLIPGWVDEGLAQWIEGDENPVLKASLKKYLAEEEPISLGLLQGGFTKLPNSIVPAAYAESLVAMQAIIKAYGTEKIGIYLALLRSGMPQERAFHQAFGLPLQTFEAKLEQTLIAWGQTSTRTTSTKLHLKTSRGRAQPKGAYPRVGYPVRKTPKTSHHQN